MHKNLFDESHEFYLILYNVQNFQHSLFMRVDQHGVRMVKFSGANVKNLEQTITQLIN